MDIISGSFGIGIPNTSGVIYQEHACICTPRLVKVNYCEGPILILPCMKWAQSVESQMYGCPAWPTIKEDYYWILLRLIQRLNEQVMNVLSPCHVVMPAVPFRIHYLLWKSW